MTRLTLGLLWLLRLLPLPLLDLLGEAAGLLLYALAAERRRVALTNLALCFPEQSGARRRALARRHFRAFGRSFVERGVLWWSRRERILAWVGVEGEEHLAALEGRPVILLAPHFVGLDAGWARLTATRRLSSMYSRQKSDRFDRLLYAGRTRFNDPLLVSRQEGLRPIVRALRQGLPFYYLPDMDYGPRDAVFVPFFGVPAATITGLSRLAALAGAKVVPCVTTRRPGSGYRVRFHPAWEDFPGPDPAADARRMNAFIEDRVREAPEEYFWLHKRFKTRPGGEARFYP